MGITLTSKTINSTYDSLLKLSDNDSLTGAFKVITDGLGNDTGVSLNNTGDVTISGTLTVNTRINTPLLQLTGGTGTQGELSWNTDEETVDLILNGSTLQLGQETHVHVRNNSTTTAIPNGTPVYVTGTLGASGRLKVAPMIANGDIDAKYFIGVTTEEIGADEDGKVTWFGKVRGFDTTPYGEGVELYVSETVAGGWQTTRPTAPNPVLEVAFTVNDKSNGTIFVRSDNGHSLSTNNDVSLSSVADKDLLVWDSTNEYWKNSKTLGNITTGTISSGNITTSGYLRGPETFIIDPAAYGNNTGLVQILGDLRVDGTTTTVNSTTVTINDKNIVLADEAATAGDADGAGITINGAGATLTYASTTDDFHFNKNVNASTFIGALTGNVTGNVTGNLTGNADTATTATSAGNSDTVDNKHAADFTLDYVTSNGATTSNSIGIGGSNTNTDYGIWLQGNKWLATQYSDSHDVVRINANTVGGLDIFNQTDSAFAQVRAGSYSVGGTTVIDSSRNVAGVNGTFSGKVVAQDWFVSDENTSIAGSSTYDWIHLGAYSSDASRAAAVQIGDVDGARYAIMGGGYDLTFAKHLGTSNTWSNIMRFEALGVDSAADVRILNDLTVDGQLSVSGTIDLSNADLNIGAADIIFDMTSTQSNRGLVWDISGTGFVSKFVGGGTNGGMVELYTNMDDSITGASNIFQLKNGSSGDVVFSFDANSDSTLDGNVLINGLITIPQNPVGTTYGDGVSTKPSYLFEQAAGDSDGIRMYAEAGVSNDVKYIFEVVDDIEDGDTWIFRNKQTYSPYTANEVVKISGSGDITANKYTKTGGTSSQFLKADGSVDSSSYLTTTGKAADSNLLDGYDQSVFFKSDRGQFGDSNIGFGATTGFTNTPISGAYFVDHVGYSSNLAVFNSSGSANTIAIQTHYNGSMYVHSNTDGTAWYSYKIWTESNDGATSGLDADLLDGLQGSQYLRSDTSGSISGSLTTTGLTVNGTAHVSSTLSMSSGQQFRINGSTDANHFLRQVTTGYSGFTVDGPQLQGHQGGELTTNNGGDNWALRWGLGGDVYVNEFLGLNSSKSERQVEFRNIRNGNGTAASDTPASIFVSEYGDHSWGIVTEFRIDGNNSGNDRPSIKFSSGKTDTNWAIGYGYSDDQFRIRQNIGLKDDGTNTSWGTERFRIDTSGNVHVSATVNAGGVSTNAITSTTISASGTITSSSTLPFRFTSFGTGTYNIGVMYAQQGNYVLEAPLQTDSSTANRVPIIFTWRGGFNAKGGLQLGGSSSLYTNNYGLGINDSNPQRGLVSADYGYDLSGKKSLYDVAYTSDGLWGANSRPNYLSTNGYSGSYSRKGTSQAGLVMGYQDNGSGLYAPAYGFETKTIDGLSNTATQKAIILKDTDTGNHNFIVYNTGGAAFKGNVNIYESNNASIHLETKNSSAYRAEMRAAYSYSTPVTMSGYNGYAFLETKDGGNGVQLLTLNSPRLFINSSGNTTLGSSTSSSERLRVEGNIQSTGYVKSEDYKSIGDWAWHWYGVRLPTYIGDTYTRLYDYFYDAGTAPQAETYVDTHNINDNAYMGENVWGDVHQYRAMFRTHIHVKRAFTVTNAQLNGDDPYSLWIDGVYVAGRSSCCTATPYTYTFTAGWHKIELVYSEGGGGHYVQLGWNPKNYKDYIDAMNPIGPADLYNLNGFSWKDGILMINNSSDLGAGVLQVTDKPNRWCTTFHSQNPAGGNYYLLNLKTSTTNIGAIISDGTNLQYSSNSEFRWVLNGTEKFRMQTSGTLHADGDVVAYSTTISDKRLKDEVETIPNALNKIKALRGVSYVWNDGSRKGQKDLGVIAQEVEEVLPEIVREYEMPLMDDSGEKYKTVDYEKIVGVLIEAIKEQQEQIDELKRRLDGSTK